MGAHSLRRQAENLGMFSLEKIVWTPLSFFQNLKRFQGRRRGIIHQELQEQDEGNGFTLREGKFRLDVWKKFFTVGLGRHI